MSFIMKLTLCLLMIRSSHGKKRNFIITFVDQNSNPFVWLTVLLATGHQAMEYGEPWLYYWAISEVINVVICSIKLTWLPTFFMQCDLLWSQHYGHWWSGPPIVKGTNSWLYIYIRIVIKTRSLHLCCYVSKQLTNPNSVLTVSFLGQI